MLYDQCRAQKPIDNIGGDRGVLARFGGFLDVGAVAKGVDGWLYELAGRGRGRVDYVERVNAAGWRSGWTTGNFR